MGDITPCCKFQKHYYNQQFNIQTHSLSDYSNSELVNQIKEEFQQGIWPQGCDRCRIEESAGIQSKRQLDYSRWGSEYQKYDLNREDFITASIAFGNTCNLKCITCGPGPSSRWQKEYLELYGKEIKHFKFYKKNFVADFIKQTDKIIHLDIPGGEPFLSGVDEQKELLRHYIQQGQSKQISLHYTTNAQIFPDPSWWSLWKHFKEVDLQLSIDGVEARYEYIRFPASWPTLIDNVNRYLQAQHDLENIRLSVSHTVSAYNIYYLDEFVEWCYYIGLPKPWLGRVHRPDFMRPTVWPDTVKKLIINRLDSNQMEEIRQMVQLLINHDDSELFKTFKTQTKAHDQYRNLKFSRVFPELSDYI